MFGRRRSRWVTPVLLATALAVIASLTAGSALSTRPPAAPKRPGVVSAAFTHLLQQARQARKTPTTPVPARPGPPGQAGPGKPVPVRATCAQPAKGHAACFALMRTDVTGHKGLFTRNLVPSGYGPADLRSAYNLPSGTAGAGQTVAIVDAYNDPNAEADLAAYRQQYGLPPCTTADGCFRKVDANGGTNYPKPDAGWSTEISLDLDMVSAICPQCHILLVEATDNQLSSLGQAVNEAVALGAKFVSNSYGGAENPAETSWDAQYYDHPGVAVTASSGDSGYGVQFPAASPHVTAVGGTSLQSAPGSPRGWTEAAWAGAGSGCSAYEPKPAWQRDTGCANRTVADVSAVADPATGVAVYDTYQVSGWTVFGGTSVASPVIASAYALGGTPSGGYPASGPYAHASQLNDVTSGTNSLGGCSPAYLCTAGPGYDGPTGLGTPYGVAAFSSGPQGDIAGTATASGTGKPVADALIDAGGYIAKTDAQGKYDLFVPPGSYGVTASAFGYLSTTVSGVQVTAGNQASENFALATAPFVTVSGTVTDGSGHGWPLYATVHAAGTPVSATTDPSTGHYSMSLPASQAYTLRVTGLYYGYQTADQAVQVGSTGTQQNVTLTIDPGECGPYTLGYGYPGITQGFDGRSVPAGWTVTDSAGTGRTWRFDNPSGTENVTIMNGNQFGIGQGNFAQLRPATTGTVDTTLTSPVTDMSGYANPTLSFDTMYIPRSLRSSVGTASVDVSLDGGQTWANVWQHSNDSDPNGFSGFWIGLQTIPLPQAAGHQHVQVRFHFSGTNAYLDQNLIWQVDNVFLGSGNCQPVPGGLVVGHVTDANTGVSVNHATVSGAGTSAGTGPDYFGGRSVGDGFYAAQMPAGAHQVTAAKTYYASQQKAVTVTANGVTRADFSLTAGQLKVSGPAPVNAQLGGAAKTTSVTITNTGTRPATVNVTAAQGGTTVQQAGRSAGSRRPAVGSAWTHLADFPMALTGNAAATDPSTGVVYSVGGQWDPGLYAPTLFPDAFYSYNPATDAYDYYLPPPPDDTTLGIGKLVAGAAFVDGKLYVVGGAGSPETAIYDPRTNAWTVGTPIPKDYFKSTVTTLNGRIYVIGGCRASTGFPAVCGQTDVQVYDPATATWSTAASYPEPIAGAACGAISGKIYCAGGGSDALGNDTTDAYVYNPQTDAWRPVAPMPDALMYGSFSTAGGKLLVAGGWNHLTSPGLFTTSGEGFAYDPAANTWSTLPSQITPVSLGGSACGMYAIAGATAAPYTASVATQLLGGNQPCGGDTGLPWLSVKPAAPVTIAPGHTATVPVTVNPSDPSVIQPGTFTAHLQIGQDTPYDAGPAELTAHIAPPSRWAELTGTVSGLDCRGGATPLAGATVQVQSRSGTHVVPTDAQGHYTIWLSRADGPVTVFAAADGWQPVRQAITLHSQPTTDDIRLRTDFPCSGPSGQTEASK